MEYHLNKNSFEKIAEIYKNKKISSLDTIHPSMYTYIRSLDAYSRNHYTIANEGSKISDDVATFEKAINELLIFKPDELSGFTCTWLVDKNEEFYFHAVWEPWNSLENWSKSYMLYISEILDFGQYTKNGFQRIISIISELYDNSIYHGYKNNRDVLNIISSQFTLTSECLYLTFTDMGYTIPKMILESEKYDGNRNPIDALKWALKKGNTTKEFGGMGLSLVDALSTVGELIIVSGNAYGVKNNGRWDYIKTNNFIHGTTIAYKVWIKDIVNAKDDVWLISNTGEKTDEIIKLEKEHNEKLKEEIKESKWKDWL